MILNYNFETSNFPDFVMCFTCRRKHTLIYNYILFYKLNNEIDSFTRLCNFESGVKWNQKQLLLNNCHLSLYTSCFFIPDCFSANKLSSNLWPDVEFFVKGIICEWNMITIIAFVNLFPSLFSFQLFISKHLFARHFNKIPLVVWK